MNKDIKELISFSKTLKVLYVEDNKEARESTLLMLANLFDNIVTAINGAEALDKFNAYTFDLILSDINMPVMSGIELLQLVRDKNKEIPFIIISAHNDSDFFLDTIKLGVDGYILKPIEITQLLNTLTKSIKKIKLEKDSEIYKVVLEEQVEQRTKDIVILNKEIQETQKEIVFTMGAIGEARSKETGAHVKRVAEYSKMLALYYGLDENYAEMLKQASPMHDIGKIAIPDAVLNKPGRFDEEERKIMNTHSLLGYEMLNSSSKSLLKLAATVAYEHHEKWDGSGYPQGLKGEKIDIAGRITAVADVFDALGSNRVYKKAWDDEKIFKLFKEERGTHFDPKLVDIFFDNLDKFLKVRDEYK